MSYQMHRLRRQLDELRSLHAEVEQSLAAEREERLQATITDAAKHLRGINQPQQLLKLLIGNGTLIDNDGRLETRWGEPIASALPEVLKQEEYSHFRATAASPHESSGRYFQGGSAMPDTETMARALSDPAQAEALFKEAEGLVSSTPVPATTGSPRPSVERPAPPAGDTITDAEAQAAIADPKRMEALLARLGDQV